jgi:hypothetical protein
MTPFPKTTTKKCGLDYQQSYDYFTQQNVPPFSYESVKAMSKIITSCVTQSL